MGIEVRKLDDEFEWDQLISRARGVSYFHQENVLEIIEGYSSSRLVQLCGFKGEQPIAIFPIFELSKGPITTVFSPPPRLQIPVLGPLLLNTDQLKQSKIEKRNRRFIESSLVWIEENLRPKYIHIKTTPGYRDIRPFTWNNFEAQVGYTYQIDLSPSAKELMDRFKKSLRSDIRRTEDEAYSIRRGGVDDLRFVIEKIRERYAAQNREYNIPTNYVLDLYESTPDNRMPVYIGLVEGERVSGIINPRFNSTMYYWQGGGKPDISLPMNDLIHWRIIRDGMNEDIKKYDLVGANTPRICRYKSKFNPDLKPYYTLERGTKMMNIVSGMYKKLR